MEKLGCCKTDQEPHKAFYKKYAGRTLKERVSLMDEIDSLYKAPTILNDDGTLSVFLALGKENHFTCPCSCKMINDIKASGELFSFSTFYACCGGHVKALWQASLGVEPRLKNVISSAISTRGRKRCEFLFDILE